MLRGSHAPLLCPHPHPHPQVRLRNTINTALRCFAGRYGLKEPRAILDVACSAGISSRWLATEYPEAQVRDQCFAHELKRLLKPKGPTFAQCCCIV